MARWCRATRRRSRSGRAGRSPSPRGPRRLAAQRARRSTRPRCGQRCQRAGRAGRWSTAADGYPALLLDDPQPPPVLFAQGARAARRAAGRHRRHAQRHRGRSRRRRASHRRRAGGAGVHVVSGLARGVDGCAHRGVLARRRRRAGPIGVVASGLDVVYPREHRDLWAAAGDCGLLLSEAAARHPARAVPVPAAQPHRGRAVGGGRGGRVARDGRLAHHRRRGARPRRAGDGGARQPVESSGVGGHERAAPRRRGAGARRGRRARRCCSSTISLAARWRPSRRRRRPRPDDLRGLPGARATSRAPSTGWCWSPDLSLVEAAMRLARLEAAGWLAEADGWFECVGSPLR